MGSEYHFDRSVWIFISRGSNLMDGQFQFQFESLMKQLIEKQNDLVNYFMGFEWHFDKSEKWFISERKSLDAQSAKTNLYHKELDEIRLSQ